MGDDREVVKSTMPAFADDQFAEVASDIWSEAAIAHVRAATVGRVAADNTHPFSFGAWTFRRGIRDCAVCGTSHCPSADDDYRSVVVASEPITDEHWTEASEASVLGVEPGTYGLTRNLLATAV